MGLLKKLSSLIATEKPVSELYNVVLMDCGLEKISVIKEIRLLTGLGLAQAKYVAEHTPIILKKDLTLKEAMEIKQTFAKVGETIAFQKVKNK